MSLTMPGLDNTHGAPRLGHTQCMRLALVLVTSALSLGLAGCGTGAGIRHSANFTDNAAMTPRLTQEQADDISIYALGLVGTPYRYGGNTPDSGFDCSGLIAHVFKTSVGVVPPRTVTKLSDWGNPVPKDNLRSGDLVLFAQNDVPTHAGIYVGEGRFVHSPSTGGEVRLDHLTSKYWSSQQVAFRRP